MRTVLIVLAVLLGVGAVFWLLRRRKTLVGQKNGIGYAPPTAVGIPSGRPNAVSSIFSGAANVAGAANNISAKGCSLIAGAKGVPSGLAGAACSAYMKLTPIGWAQTGLSAVAHPVDTVKSVGSAIGTGAKAVGHVFSSIF